MILNNYETTYVPLTYSEIKPYLNTNSIGRNYLYFETIGSTNVYCKALALEDKPHGTIVVSERQTAGQGTKGRSWISPMGKGIWFSLLLRPDMTATDLGKITQIASAALVSMFEDFDINARIKWPNDIIVDDKKICGILTEAKLKGNSIDHIVLGIGINVNLNNDDFGSELGCIATSMQKSRNATFNRGEVLSTFLNYFETYYEEFLSNSSNSYFQIYKDRSYILNKKVNLIKNNAPTLVIPIDILSDGALLVKKQDESIEKIYSGEVSLRLAD